MISGLRPLIIPQSEIPKPVRLGTKAVLNLESSESAASFVSLFRQMFETTIEQEGIVLYE